MCTQWERTHANLLSGYAAVCEHAAAHVKLGEQRRQAAQPAPEEREHLRGDTGQSGSLDLQQIEAPIDKREPEMHQGQPYRC